jgi:parallel beta-helix repeat protein
MTYMFKLSRRTARLPLALGCGSAKILLLFSILISACNSDTTTAPDASPEDLSASPADTELAAAGTQVVISPGQSIQAKVNSYPAGTQFLLKAGTYYGQRVVPKSGNEFIGEPGAILNGQDKTPHAFDRGSSPFPSNVRIKGLIIEHYAPPEQFGAILAGGRKTQNTTGWVIENCEIRYNKTGGIRVGNKTKILNNFIHHNKQVGISGTGDSVLVEGNEISFNNYLKIYPFGNVLGGAKLVNTLWLTVRGNKVHDNQGNGIWTDIANRYALIENNVLTANSGAGIMHEIGYDIVIRNNTATKNGYARDWITGAGILISASANATVYGNTVLDNKQGIVGIQQKREHGGVDYSDNLKNLYVHDNTVRVPSGGVSGVSSGVSSLTYTSRNNRFVSNTYDMGADAKPFTWMSGRRTKSEWQKYGNDVNGTFY